MKDEIPVRIVADDFPVVVGDLLLHDGKVVFETEVVAGVCGNEGRIHDGAKGVLLCYVGEYVSELFENGGAVEDDRADEVEGDVGVVGRERLGEVIGVAGGGRRGEIGEEGEGAVDVGGECMGAVER
jgi:hypothetical protein